MSLHLVECGLTNAVMFAADGAVLQPSEVLHRKAILVERGSFRPVTMVTVDMLNCATAQFVQDPLVRGKEVVVLMEITMGTCSRPASLTTQDFLDRVDTLGALGQTVLISNYGEFHRLAAFLFGCTKKMIGLVMGVPTLQEIFEEKYYADLDGGILESFGRLFKNDLKLYIYPYRDPATGTIITAADLPVAPHLRPLHAYLLQNRFIQDLATPHADCLPIFSPDVLQHIRQNDAVWEAMVPPQVAGMIKERKLFGYRG